MVMLAVPASRLGEVFALLGSVSGVALAAAASTGNATTGATAAPSPAAAAATGSVAQDDTSMGDNTGKVDAAGTVFDPARHTGTTVKSGLWRMKAGIARPEHESEKSPNYVDPNAQASTAPAAASNVAPAADDDDEFAAFTAANNASSAATKTARTWTDADLSKLTNQAAQKLGAPDKVRETIGQFVPVGETPHSRNIPADQREAFAQAIEKVAGIEYAG
uniref:Uncharacterized protein n=1 Tax=Mycena chlorophos TaxID=658473 RepID=A0ABQ0KTU3_MYCCL|nr:predicted protein [Mycena chlorophos]